MKYFTQEELQPSENTLRLIRQIAHAYQRAKDSQRLGSYCMS